MRIAVLPAGQLAAYMELPEIISAMKGNAGEMLTHHLPGLLVRSQTSYKAMKSFRHNEFFKESFGLTTLYSADTLRLYLDALAEDAPSIMEQVQEWSNRLLRKAHFTGVRSVRMNIYP
jgi:hypothetical protein